MFEADQRTYFDYEMRRWPSSYLSTQLHISFVSRIPPRAASRAERSCPIAQICPGSVLYDGTKHSCMIATDPNTIHKVSRLFVALFGSSGK